MKKFALIVGAMIGFGLIYNKGYDRGWTEGIKWEQDEEFHRVVDRDLDEIANEES